MEEKSQQLAIKAFADAMQKYHHNFFYNKLWILVSSLIIILQAATLYQLLLGFSSVSIWYLPGIFLLAYLVTDFINGLVHMYMDNNVRYQSLAGPLIAAFHLHHKTPLYRYQPAYKIYFTESGTKYWLLVFLIFVFYCQIKQYLIFEMNFFLVSIGVLSSFAEVSHYWCHNSTKDQIIIQKLQRYRILLPKRHHAHHHKSDNKNYAFLNGMSDPVLNVIANIFYVGYKNLSDKHVNAYQCCHPERSEGSLNV